MKAAAPALALLASCGGAYVATEPASADLRVVVTFAGGESSAVALAGSEPYRRALDELFARDASLEVWVFPYTLEALRAAIPALQERSAEDVAELLDPRVEATPSEESFAPPPSASVLHAQIDGGTSTDVAYETKGWADWLAAAKGGFTFHLPMEIGCPAGGVEVRAFDLAHPEVSCPGRRTRGCRWEVTCATPRSLCDRASVSGARELPDGTLALGAATCARETPSVLGSDGAWRCAPDTCGGVEVEVAVQDVRQTTLGGMSRPWVPSPSPAAQVMLGTGNLPTFGGELTSTGKGAIYAYSQSGSVRFHSFQMSRSAAGAAVDDPIDVQLSGPAGALAISIGMVGDLQRLTADAAGSLLVLQGATGQWVIPRDTSAADVRTKYRAPVRIASAAFASRPRIGELAASRIRQRVYAAVRGGVAILDAANPTAITASTAPELGTVTGSGWRVSVGVTSSGEQVYLHKSEGTVHVFDERAAHLFSATIPGELIAVHEDGTALYRVSDFVLATCPVARTPCQERAKVYAVPPSDAVGSTRLLVMRDAWACLESGCVVGYSYGEHVGMLDLDSGHSQAIVPRTPTAASPKAVPLLFSNLSGSTLWAIATDRDETSRFERVAFPPLVQSGE